MIVGLCIFLALVVAAALVMLVRERRKSRRSSAPTGRETAEKLKAVELELAFQSATRQAIRTPLTVIYAQTRSLLERGVALDASTQNDLRRILRNAERIHSTLDRASAQNYSPESGSPTVNTDMLQMVLETLNRHSTIISAKNIDVHVDAPDKLGTVRTPSPGRLSSALDLLMQNAVRRSEPGMSVKISLQMNPAKGIRVCFSHSGELPEGHISPNILGLSYPRSIVESLGGRMGASRASTASGVNIWLELPVEAVASALGSEHWPVGEKVDTSELTVLIAEPDEDLCGLLCAQFEPAFKRVIAAANGHEAITAIRREKPDIVLCAVHLPLKSGPELCLEVKTTAETEHILVVLLTSDGTANKDERYAVADGLLCKPFDAGTALERAQWLLGRREADMTGATESAPETPDTQPVPRPEPEPDSADKFFIQKIEKLIAENMDNPDFNVDAIARGMNMSRTVLYSRFKKITGKTIATYINEFKLEKARAFLQDTSLTISEISEQLGFSSLRYFSYFFKEHTGTTPTAFRTDKK